MSKRHHLRQESAMRFRLLRMETLEGRSLLAGILSGGITEFVVTRHHDADSPPPPATFDVHSDAASDSHTPELSLGQNEPIRKVGSPLPLAQNRSRETTNSIQQWLGSRDSKRDLDGPAERDSRRDKRDDRRDPPEAEGEPPQSVPLGSLPTAQGPIANRPPATVIRPEQLPPNETSTPEPSNGVQRPATNPAVETPNSNGNNFGSPVVGQDDVAFEFDVTRASDFSTESNSLQTIDEVGLDSIDENSLGSTGFSPADQFRLKRLGESLEARAEKLALAHGIDHALSQLLIPSQFEVSSSDSAKTALNSSDVSEAQADAAQQLQRSFTRARHLWDTDDGMMALDLSEQLLPTVYASSNDLAANSAWDQPLAMTRGQGYEIAGLAARRSLAESSRSAAQTDSAAPVDADTLDRLRPVIAIASAAVGAVFLGHRRQKEADEKRRANNDPLR
ncbi:MAG: hypothetical protein AAGG44_06290 [Planctomycetota bacterium]